MPDLHAYSRDVERNLVLPEYAELVRTARRRRRVKALGGLAGIAALVAAFALLTGAPPRDATLPAVTPLPGPAMHWTAADIIDHPTGSVNVADSADPVYRSTTVPSKDVGGVLTTYWRCEDGLGYRAPGGPCGGASPVVARTVLRVTRPGATPLTLLLPPTAESAQRGSGPEGARYVGGGWFYWAQRIGPNDPPVLISAGTAAPIRLTITKNVVAPRPGQLAVPCGAWFDDDGALCVLDRQRLTLTRVNLPGAGVRWSPSTVDGYRGTQGRELLWQAPDGSFRSRHFPGPSPFGIDVPYDVPAGLIAVYDWAMGDNQLRLQVSADQGATWRVFDSPRGGWDFGQHLADDWSSWPEVKP